MGICKETYTRSLKKEKQNKKKRRKSNKSSKVKNKIWFGKGDIGG